MFHAADDIFPKFMIKSEIMRFSKVNSGFRNVQ